MKSYEYKTIRGLDGTECTLKVLPDGTVRLWVAFRKHEVLLSKIGQKRLMEFLQRWAECGEHEGKGSGDS